MDSFRQRVLVVAQNDCFSAEVSYYFGWLIAFIAVRFFGIPIKWLAINYLPFWLPPPKLQISV